MRNVSKNTFSPAVLFQLSLIFEIQFWEKQLRNLYEPVGTGHNINVVKPSNPICAKRCLLLKCPNTSKSRMKWFVLSMCYASMGPISFVWPCALTFDYLETSFTLPSFMPVKHWSGKASFSSSNEISSLPKEVREQDPKELQHCCVY